MKPYLFALLFFFIIGVSCFAQPTLFGMTSNGGNQCGSIFSLPLGGNSLNFVKYFDCQTGDAPASGLLKANGKLYGYTSQGGADNFGILFEFDTLTQAFTELFEFNDTTGIFPVGTPTLAPNGKLYGVTSGGGSQYADYLFEYDLASNVYNKKINIYQYSGAYPNGSLTYATNGKLYGLTENGGANHLGDIYEYDYISNTYTSIFSFSSSGGYNPKGSMILANNGKLYGCTQNGGANGAGTIYEYDFISNTYTDKFDFSSALGTHPSGSLFQSSNGKLYGLTQSGAGGGSGALFEYDYNSSIFIRKLNFNTLSLSYPIGSLIEASNGKLYGATQLGGVYAQGAIFEFDINSNVATKLVDLSGSTGVSIEYNLIEGSNGKLFGLAMAGGVANKGVFFQYDISTGVFTNVINFGSSLTGSYPEETLLHAANGKLYGMTPSGGLYGQGVLFEYDYLTDNYIVKFDFNDTMGINPKASLIEVSPGRLFGMTSRGGANNAGVIFEYNYLTDVYDKKYDFIGSSGSNPKGSLALASNGKLYGWTDGGGMSILNNGVIFEYDYTTNTYTRKKDLVTVSRPAGSLVQANNGKLYGLTKNGGTNNQGTLVEYDYMTDSLSIRYEFGYGYINGSPFQGSIVQAYNNKLYGMTYFGGTHNVGIIFEFDPQSYSFSTRFTFNSVLGSYPRGSLLQGSNGKLYGMTTCGGTYMKGVVFEYDFTNNIYTKSVDLYSATGFNAIGALIELNYGLSDIPNVQKNGGLIVYPNPTTGMIHAKFFSLQNSDDYSLSLIDMTGRVVLSSSGICSVGSNQSDLDLKKIAKGLYLLRLQSLKFSETIPLSVN